MRQALADQDAANVATADRQRSAQSAEVTARRPLFAGPAGAWDTAEISIAARNQLAQAICRRLRTAAFILAACLVAALGRVEADQAIGLSARSNRVAVND
jgi:hypothetical protein